MVHGPSTKVDETLEVTEVDEPKEVIKVNKTKEAVNIEVVETKETVLKLQGM